MVAFILRSVLELHRNDYFILNKICLVGLFKISQIIKLTSSQKKNGDEKKREIIMFIYALKTRIGAKFINLTLKNVWNRLRRMRRRRNGWRKTKWGNRIARR